MEGGFREWLAGLGRREMIALSLVGAAITAGAGLWYVRSLPRPIETVELSQPVAGPSPTPAAAVFVHVAGWVRNPGVYELRAGERVIDAIDRAGGPRRGADLNALNLAALVADAQQVLVPRRAAIPPDAAGAVTSSSGEGQKINVNLATAEELETLPGIGEVLAQRIIEHREKNGPFGSVDELLEVSGIGESRLEDISDDVTV
jgi:competence protein ComEA